MGLGLGSADFTHYLHLHGNDRVEPGGCPALELDGDLGRGRVGVRVRRVRIRVRVRVRVRVKALELDGDRVVDSAPVGIVRVRGDEPG